MISLFVCKVKSGGEAQWSNISDSTVIFISVLFYGCKCSCCLQRMLIHVSYYVDLINNQYVVYNSYFGLTPVKLHKLCLYTVGCFCTFRAKFKIE